VSAPLITIVVPCYNYAEYLEECLRSVVAQTYPHWEAVVVDDASTQGDVAAVVARIGDARIRLVRHAQNQGLAAARNTGIRAGQGELVLPLDADDKLAPAYLETLVPLLTGHPEYTAAFPDFYAFGARDGIIRFQVRDVRALLRDQWVPGPGTLFRRTLWQQVGGYCDALRAGNEDWDFWLGAAEQGLRVAHVPQALYYYRQHPDSMAIRQRSTESVTREFLYTRHRLLFDQFGMGGVFRAEGYRRSAGAAWQRGERGRAIRLAGRGLYLAPRSFMRATARAIRVALRRA
jgi:glycosyltransferase involved in cell wall biosynthesis